MTAYIDWVDIRPDGLVSVSGNVASTNIEVSLSPRVHVVEPEDGIWDYDLAIRYVGPTVAHMLVPFVTTSELPAGECNGVRIHYPGPGGKQARTTQLKARIVEEFTEETENPLALQAAHFDAAKSHLVVDVQYGGGLFEHAYALEWDGQVRKSLPGQYWLNLVDLSNHDQGKAIKTAQLRFDLTGPELNLQEEALLVIHTPLGGTPLVVKANSPNTDG